MCWLVAPVVDPAPATLSLTIELETTEHQSGDAILGSLRITNLSDTIQSIRTGGTQTMTVFNVGTLDPVGGWVGGTTNEGKEADLAPGETLETNLVGSTISCDLSLGYTLPPGTYDVRAVVSLNGVTVLSDPVTIDVTER